MAEYACRAVYNMCSEPSFVSEFGAKGVCGLVVATLQVRTRVRCTRLRVSVSLYVCLFACVCMSVWERICG